jgi:ubiquitin-protein ligase
MQSFNARIQKEIQSGYQSKSFKFFFDADGKYGEKNAAYIRFTAPGDMYRGQIHILRIRFSYGSNVSYVFPKNPPNIVFLTPIYHTNISTEGSICLDVLKDEKWSPIYDVETIFASIIGLLDDPNTTSPFNRDASANYSEHLEKGTMSEYKKLCYNYYHSKMKNDTSIVSKLLHAPEFDESTTTK